MRTVEAGLHRRCVLLAVAACWVAALWASPASAADQYDIGTLPGYRASTAMALNNNSQAAGVALAMDGTQHAFLYSAGAMTDLGTLGGAFSSATGINSTGQVVGYSSLPNALQHAFLYSNGVMTDLGTLPGGTWSYAAAINDSGEIVGWGDRPDNSAHAFLYSQGTMTDLGTIPGYANSFATAISSSGLIAGYVKGSWQNYHAFVVSNGIFTDLGALYTGNTWAMGINDSGQVAGYMAPQTGTEHAFLYSGGVLTDVGALIYSYNGAFVRSFGYAINSSGQVVGRSDQGAFLYSDGYSVAGDWLMDGPPSAEARAITDTGLVAGSVDPINGNAFILNVASRPVITTVSPNEFTIGTRSMTLTVSGKNFTPDALVYWDGLNKPTTYVNATELTAQLGMDDLDGIEYVVTVWTPAGRSGGVFVRMTDPAPRPKPRVPEIGRRRGSTDAQ